MNKAKRYTYPNPTPLQLRWNSPIFHNAQIGNAQTERERLLWIIPLSDEMAKVNQKAVDFPH